MLCLAGDSDYLSEYMHGFFRLLTPTMKPWSWNALSGAITETISHRAESRKRSNSFSDTSFFPIQLGLE